MTNVAQRSPTEVGLVHSAFLAVCDKKMKNGVSQNGMDEHSASVTYCKALHCHPQSSSIPCSVGRGRHICPVPCSTSRWYFSWLQNWKQCRCACTVLRQRYLLVGFQWDLWYCTLLYTSTDLPGSCFNICNIAQCRGMENMIGSVIWIYIEMKAHEGTRHGQHLVREHRILIRLLLSDSQLQIAFGIYPWFLFLFFLFFKHNVLLLKAI